MQREPLRFAACRNAPCSAHLGKAPRVDLVQTVRMRVPFWVQTRAEVAGQPPRSGSEVGAARVAVCSKAKTCAALTLKASLRQVERMCLALLDLLLRPRPVRASCFALIQTGLVISAIDLVEVSPWRWP